MNVQDIRLLVDYTDWANQLMLDTVELISVEDQRRDRGMSYLSLWGTLWHMLMAERVWLSRWKGVPPAEPPAADSFPNLEALRDSWKRIEAERRAFVDGLSDDAVQAELTYKDTHGNEFTNVLGLFIQHAVNHATFHRGQVIGLVRQLGIKPPETDFDLFLLSPGSR